jgi:hypothetical protein
MNAQLVATGNTALTPTSMESAIQLAEMMARGKLVPAHLHNSPGDCLMVIEASMRWQMSPFAVAQCTSVIQGKLMFEGKLVAAALNASGLLSTRLDYDYSGEGAQRAVTVRGTIRGETKVREVTVFLADAKTTNQMWTKQPDQQLVYAATRVWARRHAPEVMLGVYAPEEFDRADAFAGPTLEHTDRDAVNDAVPLKAAAAATPKPERRVDPTVYETKPALELLEEPDSRVWLLNLERLLANATSQDEVMEISAYHTVGTATVKAPGSVKARVSELLVKAYARFAEEPDELPQVEIAGAENMASG